MWFQELAAVCNDKSIASFSTNWAIAPGSTIDERTALKGLRDHRHIPAFNFEGGAPWIH